MDTTIDVAIIDDEKNILEMLERFFKTQPNFRVRTFQNPLTALSAMEAKTQVILLDIMMPQINGLDLLPQLEAKYPKSKVIMMTAYSTLEKVLEAHRKGAVQYVMKPFDSLMDLQKKIIEVIEKG